MKLDKSINNLSQRLNKIYPDTSNINYNDSINYWKGKKIIPLDLWLKIKEEHYSVKTALQYFPDDFVSYLFPLIDKDNIEDPKLKEEADKWHSDFIELMEYRKNPTYGKTKCSRCLLSPVREQAAIFLGIDKVIAKALERQYNTASSIYPCPVLNIFECPYKTKDEEVNEKEEDETTTTSFDIDHLFGLSEIAFQLELALAKAQVMTKDNDTIYETNFETGKVREISTNYYGNPYPLSTDESLEEKLAEVKRLSKVPIRNADDIYHALTDKETLEKILEQGLDEEYQKYKDGIVNFFMSIKDKIRKEDLFNAQNFDVSCSDDSRRQQQYAKCLICEGFANIHCINCNNDVWLCVDHWKQHQADKHNSNSSTKVVDDEF